MKIGRSESFDVLLHGACEAMPQTDARMALC